MKRKITSVVLALAGAALLTQQAHAQYAAGDLLLGFSEAGAANDYVVNLGLASTYLNAAPGSSFTVSDGNINADLSLSSVFGSGWATNSSVQWGIVGVAGAGSNTLFFSTPELTLGVANQNPLLGKAGSTQTSIAGAIGNLGTNYNANAAGPTANSDNTAIIESASASASWASLSDNGGVAFKYAQTSDIVSNNTPSTSVLDLYELTPHNGTAGTFVGDFSLSQSGALTFTAEGAAAVPEPSSYALGITAGVLLWVLKRRKSVA